MSVNDEGDLPWLRAEKALIAESVRAGLPFFGACLGVQLLAASLGAEVVPGDAPEVGLLPVFLTEAASTDSVFAGLPRELLTLQWHGDTYSLPEGAVLLASSPAYPNQAFRWGRSAYGIQFHLELSREMAAEWTRVPAYADALTRVLGPGSATALVDQLAAHADDLRAHGRQMFERWLDLVAVAEPFGRPGVDARLTPRRNSHDDHEPLTALSSGHDHGDRELHGEASVDASRDPPEFSRASVVAEDVV
jgi:GMP synthase-like glutamine amidotransferase